MTTGSHEPAMLGRVLPSAPGMPLEIDARLIAPGLGLQPAQAHALMEAGKISLVCERGTGEDEGWRRIRFYHAGRRLVLLVDPGGRIFGA